ncbi:Hint domain-containing protein [Commensalibacter nepenthis]|uniref:Hint domain-containing protein n=1 Tax=Commensalibacter nepenthis TaxID=3043872 RepID=A0ABT6QAA5_9PROT|nr:Hint domain-containing protein [Commensalibacter sp. TBRC 10068]MDI2113846.1 Hint domain-containing protein [Commensalibacter sp. TBRC 10068]
MVTTSTIISGVVKFNQTYSANGDLITVLGSAVNFVVMNGAALNVAGHTYGTIVKQRGIENVLNGGSAATTIINNGTQNVYNWASTTSTNVNSGGIQNVYNVGSAYATSVNNSGIQTIYDGGSAFYTHINSGGYMTTTRGGVSVQAYLYSGGIEDVGFNRLTQLSSLGSSLSTQIYGGKQYVYSGGVASATTVFAGGSSFIVAGGSATDTVVNSDGMQEVYGNVKNTNLYNGGTLRVAFAGTTSGTKVGQKSVENVYSRGSATATIVSTNGTQNIYDTGSATSTIVRGGTQNIYSDASAYVAQISNGGVQNIHDGGKGFFTTVNSGGYLTTTNNGLSFQAYLSSGSIEDVGFNRFTQMSSVGSSISTQIIGGKQYVYSGGIASAATVFSQGSSFIVAGGSAVDTIVSSGGMQEVYGNTKNTNLYNSATLLVAFGGTTTGTKVGQNSVENVADGGSATGTLVQTNGLQNVYDKASATSTTVNGSGVQNVYNNASAYTTILNSTGTQNLYNGGQGFYTTINNGGVQVVLSTGVAHETTINQNGVMNISGGGLASSTNINSGGLQTISGTSKVFASATDTVILTGGQQTIYNWGTANKITLSGGTLNVSAGGKITDNVTFTPGGTLNVYSGASVSTTVTNGGREFIYDGGLTNSTTVNNGFQYIMGGGVTSNTTVSNDGVIFVSGGTVNTISVSDGGELKVLSGTVNGVNVADNGVVVVNGGTISDTIVQYGGVLNATSGTLGKTTVSAGGAVIYTDGSVTITGKFILKSGSFLNGRQVLQDISLDDSTKINVTALLDDPTLFAPASVATPASMSLMTSREFVTPIPYNDASSLPTTDGSGNPITWDDGDALVDDSQAAKDFDIRNYTVTSNGNGYVSFLPPGQTERIWGVGMLDNSASQYLPGGGPFGSILIYSANDTKVVMRETNPDKKSYKTATYIAKGGIVNVNSDATIENLSVYSGGTLNATQGRVEKLHVGQSGIANFDGASIGTLSLDSGGSANITTSTGGVISLQGTENKGLVISGTASKDGTQVSSTIADFDGNDSITLKDIQRSQIAGVKFPDKDHMTITLLDGSSVTLHIIDIETTGYTLGENSDGSTFIEACFLAGTAISTPNGTMAIETISTHDIIETFDWQTNQVIHSAVTWIGQKHMTINVNQPDDLAGYPVRVLKGAIDDNVPNQDLLITPEHCLFFDGNFVPVRMLVNGRSIYYDRSITSYDYYHIETEKHSVIWANGTLTESYLDTGNRNVFSTNQKVVSLFNETKTWDVDAAAPLNVQRDVVEPIYNQINNRAVHSNIASKTEILSLTTDPELCLETGLGKIIEPHLAQNGRYVFIIPEGVNIVNILSRTSRPCETIGSFVDDRRYLGVLVSKAFIMSNNSVHELTDYLSDESLEGWDIVENAPCRWTNGKATLNIHTNYPEQRLLVLNILAGGPYIEELCSNEQNKIAS